MNADLISHSGGYAENIDKSGLIRGRIVEESLMGRNAARRFQQEINEIVQDNVPLYFLPLWKKITIKMQIVIKKHFKKQNLLVRWDKKRVLTSEPADSALSTHRTRLWSSTLLVYSALPVTVAA
jgi:hypothetical protein